MIGQTLRIVCLSFIILTCLGTQFGLVASCSAADVSGLKLRKKLPGSCPGAALSVDGRSLALSCDDGVLIWEMATGRVRAKVEPGWRYRWSFTFSRDGKLLYGDEAGKIFSFDMATGKLNSFQAHTKQVFCLATCADRIASVSSRFPNSIVKFWDLKTAELQVSLKMDRIDSIGTFNFSPNGETLVVSGSRSKMNSQDREKLVEFWDLRKKQILHTKEGGGGHFTFIPNNENLLVFSEMRPDYSNHVVTWNLHEKRQSGDLRVNMAVINDMALSPNGKTLLVAGYDGFAMSIATWRLIDLPSQKTLDSMTFDQKKSTAYCFAAFTPDGTKVVMAGQVGHVEIYDVIGAEPVDRMGECKAILQKQKDDRREEAVLVKAEKDRLDGLWKDLLKENAAIAYKGMCAMIATPCETVAFLETQMRPVAVPHPERVAKLMALLEGTLPVEQESAAKELRELADVVKKPLAAALAKPLPKDAKDRIRGLLQSLDDEINPEILRTMRALEVLEYVGTSSAKLLLGRMAQGASESRVTFDACASLVRLQRSK